MRCSTS